MSIELVASNIAQALTQLVTGKLLTDRQIRAISTNVIGRYFTDWLATPKDERQLDDRITEARNHLKRATEIILEFKDNLDTQTKQLDEVASQLNENKAEAQRYAALAKAGGEAVAAIRQELQAGLRDELEAQARKGRRLRQAVSFVVWLVTLFLGSYLPQIVDWSRARLSEPAKHNNVQFRPRSTTPATSQPPSANPPSATAGTVSR